MLTVGGWSHGGSCVLAPFTLSLFSHSEVCPKHSRVFCRKALQGHEGEWITPSPVGATQCCGQLAKEGSPCHGCCWRAG